MESPATRVDDHAILLMGRSQVTSRSLEVIGSVEQGDDLLAAGVELPLDIMVAALIWWIRTNWLLGGSVVSMSYEFIRRR
jgi:hypothetical protein